MTLPWVATTETDRTNGRQLSLVFLLHIKHMDFVLNNFIFSGRIKSLKLIETFFFSFTHLFMSLLAPPAHRDAGVSCLQAKAGCTQVYSHYRRDKCKCFFHYYLFIFFLFKLKIAHYLINWTLFDGTNASVVMSNLRKKDVADLINVCLLFLLCIYFFNEKVLDIFKCASFSHGSLVHIYYEISQ